MAKRRDPEAIDDLENELVRSLRRWCKRPTDEAALRFRGAMRAYQRAFMADDEPEANSSVRAQRAA